jgi:hypothetical protein
VCVVESRETLVNAVFRAIVGLEVCGREPRNHPERGTQLHGQCRGLEQRRLAFFRRVRQAVATAGCHIEADVAQQVESAVEALIGIAFLEQGLDMDAPFLEQLVLDVVADSRDVVAIVLHEIQLFKRGIHLLEVGAYPAIEFLGVARHQDAYSSNSGTGRLGYRLLAGGIGVNSGLVTPTSGL